jgi:2-oxoglutarate ferredoxin oxidoreductase subunit delta
MAKVKGNVIFDEFYCKGCGLCVEICPVKIIELDETVITAKGYHPAHITDRDKCIACANCAVMCPDSAVKVEKEDLVNVE